MSVSDLIDIDYSLLQVISRMGLSLKYAGLPVAEACRNSGVDPDTFILICNVYSFPDHIPSESELEKGNIKDIIGYLHRSHSTTQEGLSVPWRPRSTDLWSLSMRGRRRLS